MHSLASLLLHATQHACVLLSFKDINWRLLWDIVLKNGGCVELDIFLTTPMPQEIANQNRQSTGILTMDSPMGEFRFIFSKSNNDIGRIKIYLEPNKTTHYSLHFILDWITSLNQETIHDNHAHESAPKTLFPEMAQ